MTTPQYYMDLLTHMSVNKNKSKIAPHKAILLLTVIDMIETGEITSPFIRITESLKANFKRVWTANVSSRSGFKQGMSYPFFHLSSSPFWELVRAASYQGQAEYSSMKALERDFSGAMIDVGLYRIMKDPHGREEIRALLKSVYLDNGSVSSNLIGITSIIAFICAIA